MRRKSEPVLMFEWNNAHQLKIVREEREKYKKISRILGGQAGRLLYLHTDRYSRSSSHGCIIAPLNLPVK